MTSRTPVSALLACLALAGCADPYAGPRKDPTPAVAVPGEQAEDGLPTQPADQPTAHELPATAELAARRAADLAYNWTARTAASRQAQLAAISTDQARRDTLQAAARLPTDPQLTSGHATSTATLAAIALRRGPSRRSGLLVTHERLVADGVHQDRWRVTLITVVRLANGWAISRWAPQE